MQQLSQSGAIVEPHLDTKPTAAKNASWGDSLTVSKPGWPLAVISRNASIDDTKMGICATEKRKEKGLPVSKSGYVRALLTLESELPRQARTQILCHWFYGSLKLRSTCYDMKQTKDMNV